jgi:serine/threonine protein kinase
MTAHPESHPDPATLRRLLDGRLGDAESSDVEAHVEVCPECEQRLDALSDLPPELLPPAFLGDEGAGEGEVTLPLPRRAAPAPPLDVPGYEILDEIGRGSGGVVYKARHLTLDRLTALKVMREGAQASPEEAARFRAEAEAAARLQHPNIVQIYEVGTWHAAEGGSPLPYLALEFVDGGSLAELVEGTPQPPREAAALVEILARAVHHAHRHGILHRDLKPGNVLLRTKAEITGPQPEPPASDGPPPGVPPRPLSDFEPKVTDFGLAKRLDRQGLVGQTLPWVVVGTASYMPPEQARSEPNIGPAADVYALGAILYDLLTGRAPFKGTTVLETLQLVQNAEPVPPRRLQPGVPRDLETVCLKCLEKDPKKRYASALELADDLQRFLGGEPVRARPVGPAGRLWRWCRRKPLVAGLTAGLAVTLFSLLAGLALAVDARTRFELARARQKQKDAETKAKLAAEKARAAKEQLRRLEAEARERQGKAAPWLERAAQARADHFHQAEAIYLATALTYSDHPGLRARWMEARQRSLAPVATSSRRLSVGTLPCSPGGSAFCPVKDLLITSHRGPDVFLRAWDTRSLRERRAYGGLAPLKNLFRNRRRVSALAVHPNGSRFVSAEPGGDLIWWEAASGKRLSTSPRVHKAFDRSQLARLAPSPWLAAQAKAGNLSWLTVTAWRGVPTASGSRRRAWTARSSCGTHGTGSW